MNMRKTSEDSALLSSRSEKLSSRSEKLSSRAAEELSSRAAEELSSRGLTAGSRQLPKNAVPLVHTYLLALQKQICHVLEEEDGKTRFLEDDWQNEKGTGKTCALAGDHILERAGVNFSHVQGQALPAAATARYPELAGSRFQALGVSVVVHPKNPYAPTAHFNVRLFVAEKDQGEAVWWFGGGFDLTPYYGFHEDCQHWHRSAKQACDPFGEEVYPTFKKQCDHYFFLKHRNEPRGIGGLFFDDLNAWGFERSFAFMRSMGEHFILGYQPLLARRKNNPYGQRERDFQLYRRGRYVEFNLIYDRGTLFGLQFGGRTESILMSMPPLVTWRYDWQPAAGTAEAQLYEEFLQPKEWV